VSVVVVTRQIKFMLTATTKDWTVFQQMYLATLIHCKSVITKILAVCVIFIILNVYFFNIRKIK